jgi:diacylglycerol kinase family enzyme
VPSVVLIVNPYASGVDELGVEQVSRALDRVAKVSVVHTERSGHASELAGELGSSADALFVFSGDGGFNEVLNGLEDDLPLGLVPGGGANVLPRALGLPRDPVAAAAQLADALASGRTRRISLGRVNGRRFAFAAGIGFDAELVRRIEAPGRSATGRRRGSLYALWAAGRILAERRGRLDAALEIRGLGRAAFGLVANTDPYTYVGPVPLHACPAARFELGLDLAAPETVQPQTLPRFLAYALTGRGRPPRLLAGHDLDRIEVVCERPQPLQADGEDLGDVERAVFESERDAVTVYI